MTIRIAVDAMGGDHGVSTTVPGSLAFLRQFPDAEVLLVGLEAELLAALKSHGAQADARLRIVAATEVVAMDDPVSVALRRKRDSSMRIALQCLREGRADAVVSSGNTGALMAVARNVLDMIDGIERPAIAAPMPNQLGGQTMVLDLGANVDCEPEHLLQFAVMGAALVSALQDKERPSVGLLNVGEEAIKGNDVVKRAGELLRESGLAFVGNVEGNDIYRGAADVIVCDGFVGNVALKASEGVAQMLTGFLRDAFSEGLFARLVALIAMPLLRRFKAKLDPRRYNGASLVGLKGVVIKSHGSSDAFGFEQALRRGYDAARNDLPQRIAQAIPRIHRAA